MSKKKSKGLFAAVNKIIPILSVIFSAVAVAISVCGVILISVAMSVPQLAVIAVPIVLASAALSAALLTLNVLFRKNILCKIAMFIDIGALAISVAAVVVWLFMP